MRKSEKILFIATPLAETSLICIVELPIRILPQITHLQTHENNPTCL